VQIFSRLLLPSSFLLFDCCITNNRFWRWIAAAVVVLLFPLFIHQAATNIFVFKCCFIICTRTSCSSALASIAGGEFKVGHPGPLVRLLVNFHELDTEQRPLDSHFSAWNPSMWYSWWISRMLLKENWRFSTLRPPSGDTIETCDQKRCGNTSKTLNRRLFMPVEKEGVVEKAQKSKKVLLSSPQRPGSKIWQKTIGISRKNGIRYRQSKEKKFDGVARVFVVCNSTWSGEFFFSKNSTNKVNCNHKTITNPLQELNGDSPFHALSARARFGFGDCFFQEQYWIFLLRSRTSAKMRWCLMKGLGAALTDFEVVTGPKLLYGPWVPPPFLRPDSSSYWFSAEIDFTGPHGVIALFFFSHRKNKNKKQKGEKFQQNFSKNSAIIFACATRTDSRRHPLLVAMDRLKGSSWPLKRNISSKKVVFFDQVEEITNHFHSGVPENTWRHSHWSLVSVSTQRPPCWKGLLKFISRKRVSRQIDLEWRTLKRVMVTANLPQSKYLLKSTDISSTFSSTGPRGEVSPKASNGSRSSSRSQLATQKARWVAVNWNLQFVLPPRQQGSGWRSS